jgi:hypothetical protein
MKTIFLVLAVLAMLVIIGCSDDTKPPVILGPWNPSAIELRASDHTIVAPADSTAQVWITAILRDQQGVAWPGEEITYSTTPPVQVGLPENGITDENGSVIFRLLVRVPADTTNLTFEAKSGALQGRLTLTLIGE